MVTLKLYLIRKPEYRRLVFEYCNITSLLILTTAEIHWNKNYKCKANDIK